MAAAPETSSVPVELAVPDWEVQTTLYLWATALDGSLGSGNLPEAGLNVPFSEILDNLDGAVMADLFVKKGSWMFLGDIVWANLSDKTTLKVGNSPTLKYDQQLLILSAIGGYELPLNVNKLDLNVTAGVRYQQLSSETTLQSGTFPISVNHDSTHAWVDPIVGLAMQYDINDRWAVKGLADIGGFGVGSQFTTQGFLSASYNWTDHFSTALGYRALYTNYESGSGANRFDYEGTLHGPYMSLGVRF
ncbi:hypothetical protein [Roseibium sp. M-1]